VDNYYTPHYCVEIFLVEHWRPVAWFVCQEDATLFHTWLCMNFPSENYRITDL